MKNLVNDQIKKIIDSVFIEALDTAKKNDFKTVAVYFNSDTEKFTVCQKHTKTEPLLWYGPVTVLQFYVDMIQQKAYVLGVERDE